MRCWQKEREKRRAFLPAKRSMPLPPRKNATSSQEEGHFLPCHSAPHHPSPFSLRAFSLFTQSEQANLRLPLFFAKSLFPYHQVTRQSYLLGLATLTSDKVVLGKRLIKFLHKGRTNTRTFLIDRIEKRICNVFYTLHGSFI